MEDETISKQEWEPEFDPQNPHKNLGVVAKPFESLSWKSSWTSPK